MYNKVSETYNNLNWDYLDISDEAINSRYDWVNISLPIEDKKFPWAHEYDIIKFFILLRTFPTKLKAVKWMEINSINLTPIHLSLLDKLCYSEITTHKTIDELIHETDSNGLLYFIHSLLDRSLLWNTPEPCWPGDFKRILRTTSEKIHLETQQLTWTSKPTVEGVDFVSGEAYTHVFYKFQNLINGIQKGEVYYDLTDLAKQAHSVLLQSMEIFFEYKYSSINEISWERKLSEITTKETNWSIALLEKKNKVKDH